MRKIVLYGTPTCGDCPPVKEALTQAGVTFAFVDVCESVGSLKKYLKIRDTAESHAMVREKHSVGIPTIVIDGEVILVNGPDHVKELVETYKLLEE
ncbi:MAG: hypothetical protein J6A26_02705 [Oscillospiraceae bacterium]|nr:hypothetical protein [Oscillospiraceae bacterium]